MVKQLVKKFIVVFSSSLGLKVGFPPCRGGVWPWRGVRRAWGFSAQCVAASSQVWTASRTWSATCWLTRVNDHSVVRIVPMVPTGSTISNYTSGAYILILLLLPLPPPPHHPQPPKRVSHKHIFLHPLVILSFCLSLSLGMEEVEDPQDCKWSTYVPWMED